MARNLIQKFRPNLVYGKGRAASNTVDVVPIAAANDNADTVSVRSDGAVRYSVCKDRSKTSKRYIFDRRNVQKRLAGLQDEYDILPPEEPSSQNRPSPSAAANKSAATGYRAFPVSTTYKNVTLPLKSSKLASPFPEPVKLMPSHTVSDQDKAAQMQAECRIPKFAVRK